jgi:PKD repeat protein
MADGGCVLVGFIKPSSSPQAGWIVRLGADGQLLWQRQYAGTYNVSFNDVSRTADGGWLVTGGANSSVGWVCQLIVLRFTSAGSLLWKAAFSGELDAGWGQSVREAPDGTVVVAGTHGCFRIPGMEPWVIKLGSNGQMLWQKVFYASGMDQPSEVVPTLDGGLVVAGFARAIAWTPTGGWVARLGASGNLLWQRLLSDTTSEYMFSSVKAGPNDSFFLFGSKRSTSLPLSRDWLAKLDGAGNLVWEHTYSGGEQISHGRLDLRPGGGLLFSAPYSPDCGHLQGTRVAATDDLGELPADCAPLDDWPSECTEASLTPTATQAGPVSLPLSALDTGASITELNLTTWLLCPSVCSLTCSATAPPTALPASPVTFNASSSSFACSATPVFGWDFGDGNRQEGPTAIHSYRFVGTYTWTLSAFVDGRCCTQTGTIFVRPCPAISLSPASLGGLVKGVSCTKTIVATGGTDPYTFAVTTGALPPGVTLSSAGVMTGAAGAAGSWTFTVTATDGQGCQGSRSYSLTVYDLFFDDDQGRCRFYVNRSTGAYKWDILAGAHAGESYSGVAVVVNGGAKIYSQPGAANALNVTFDALRKKASGYFISASGVYSTFSDSNTSSTATACQ